MCLPKWRVMFAGYTSEWPMFCRSVDSFPFWQISGARYVLFLAKVMPDFSVNFGMTCARICRKYRVPRICVLSILVVVFD